MLKIQKKNSHGRKMKTTTMTLILKNSNNDKLRQNFASINSYIDS